MRDTRYATERARATFGFPGGSEARIERLFIKRIQQDVIRFSWWKDDRLAPRPLDIDESALLQLIKNAIENKVFSDDFLTALSEMIR